MTRRRDAEASRAAILRAARELFGAQGFERATVRAVAASAGVDPALVMHYFGSKSGLFAAVARTEVHLPDLAGVAPKRVADALVPVFAALWGPDGPMLPLLRAAATSEAAAASLRSVFEEKVAPAIAPLVADHAQERAALIGAQLLGVAVSRFVVGLEALQHVDDHELVLWLRPVVAHYLTARAPTKARRPAERDRT